MNILRSCLEGRRGRTALLAAVMLALLLAAAVCSMMFGSVALTLQRIAAAVRGEDRGAAVILFELRLPRLLAAALAGAALSAAGMLLQTVTDNELCAPNIIGVNSGAGLAVMALLCLSPGLWRLLPGAAFAGAFGTALLAISISRIGRSYEQKSTLVLAGVALSSVMNAGVAFLSLKYPDVLSSYTAFSVGGFSGVTMKQLPVPFAVICAAFAAALLWAPKISVLCLGDEVAATLGVRVKAVRMAAVAAASALCAASVTFAGLLGFAGLIVPHMVRRLSDGGLRAKLVLSALCGAVIVVLSDLIGRTVFAPWELPAGIIMAFIGAPFFIYLIVKRRKNDD